MNVDVIIPIFNQSKYLEFALDSSLRQGILRKNIYLIDDCSSDLPDKIAAKYKINYLKTEKNSGPAAARNLGIKSSSSEFIAFLDADDAMLPGRILSSLSSILETGAAMVCGNYRFWVNRAAITAPFYKREVEISYQNMINNNYVASGSVLLKRDILNDIGLFNEEYLLAEDYDLWLRVVEKHKINYIHEPLYLYNRDTINKNSLTSNPNNLQLLLDNVKKIKEESLNRRK
ncbi:MAG: glycosyltransferase [Actinobacteria bacterium]|nr:glycosyltransferase [Actinomycetota bacterium]